ncbi:hypothetical protein GCM10022212_18410 [Actimicrobium antarcticum]|uniref:Uncharacterized protein n=1 Tax=Actimicrobium antarcticum TaxID=1051899 RepID=A0ABP7T6F1_9BURK
MCVNMRARNLIVHNLLIKIHTGDFLDTSYARIDEQLAEDCEYRTSASGKRLCKLVCKRR